MPSTFVCDPKQHPWEVLCLPQKKPFSGSWTSGGAAGPGGAGSETRTSGPRSSNAGLHACCRVAATANVRVTLATLCALSSCFFPQPGNPLTFRWVGVPWAQLGPCCPTALARNSTEGENGSTALGLWADLCQTIRGTCKAPSGLGSPFLECHLWESPGAECS